MPADCYLVKVGIKQGLDTSGRQVWKHKTEKAPFKHWFMTWDGEKGEIEVFHNKTLEHLRVLKDNGDFKDEAVAGRKLRMKT
jgi:hypothetical protein